MVSMWKNKVVSSLGLCRGESETCSSQLRIANENNNTKISNYMVNIDANREAEKTIYLGEVSRLTQVNSDTVDTYEKKISTVNVGRAQWVLFSVIVVIVGAAYFVLEDVNRNKGRSASNLNRGS